ncbi:MAG: TRAP transporter small permease [Qingshengfaniella sp.]
MEKLETWISRISILFAGLIVLAMMLQVVVDVFMRNFVGAGLPATAELVSRYYMVAVSFLPLAMTETARRHIEATIFTGGLTGMARTAIYLLGCGMGLIVFGLLAYGSLREAIGKTGLGAYVDVGTLRFPTWPSYWILPVSFALMEVVLILKLIQIVTGRFVDSPDDPAGQAAAQIEKV